jgi:hypothetical protein
MTTIPFGGRAALTGRRIAGWLVACLRAGFKSWQLQAPSFSIVPLGGSIRSARLPAERQRSLRTSQRTRRVTGPAARSSVTCSG